MEGGGLQYNTGNVADIGGFQNIKKFIRVIYDPYV